jgi:hypothetical protein
MRYIFYTLLMLLLTLLTQIGGLLLLILLPLLRLIRLQSKGLRALVRSAVFLLLYTVTALIITPPLASLNNRVPLPCTATADTPLAAANTGYCLLLRNYVTPEVRTRLEQVARSLHQQYPGSTLHYLDASLPFWDGFPLIPHLSHHDGRKLDLAYLYQHKQTQKQQDSPPSWLGYWFYEQPETAESAACRDTNSWLRWDFDWLQVRYADFEMDEQRTRALVQLLLPTAQKILLEPHLKQRLQPDATRIRFQGCYAARHDDHIHVQW